MLTQPIRGDEVDTGITRGVETLGQIDILVCKAGIQVIAPAEVFGPLEGSFAPPKAPYVTAKHGLIGLARVLILFVIRVRSPHRPVARGSAHGWSMQ